jgi:tRNA1(Val) A37 N6-methylase TrmN6
MLVIIICCLAAVALYLAKRVSDARVEIVDLQAQVATLKRRLVKPRR